MNQNITEKLIIAGLLFLGASAAQAAKFELKSTAAAEQGWSQEGECEAGAGGKCTPAYFCSNNIWMAEAAFLRIQDRRYAGEQLVIVKDEQPICAVN